jgi:hypothetical protein
VLVYNDKYDIQSPSTDKKNLLISKLLKSDLLNDKDFIIFYNSSNTLFFGDKKNLVHSLYSLLKTQKKNIFLGAEKENLPNFLNQKNCIFYFYSFYLLYFILFILFYY